MNIVFMGTPAFAVASLDAIVERGDKVALVISQEDKPRDRGKKIQMPAVKERALDLGLAVYQPQSIKSDEAYERLSAINPDLIVVTAYGQIVPKRILDLPKYGCINVHASLLPKYRGAAPINFVLVNGEQQTGITTMYMAEGLDTGDIILADVIDIAEEDTAATLHDKLAELSKETLTKTLALIEQGKAPRTAQVDSESSYAPLITKDMGRLDFRKSAEALVNLSRGMAVYTNYKGEKVKLFHLKKGGPIASTEYGKIKSIQPDSIEIIAKDATLKVYEIQFPNKKRLKVSDYLKGNTLDMSIKFGEE